MVISLWQMDSLFSKGGTDKYLGNFALLICTFTR